MTKGESCDFLGSMSWMVGACITGSPIIPRILILIESVFKMYIVENSHIFSD